MSTNTADQHTFQAEVQQLLNIVIHSLYTDREIFIRELISNASDALEKLRHLQYAHKDVFDDKLPLEINISTDDKAGTLTIQDFGVGMSRQELSENLGTIAHSGTKAFLQAIESGEKPADLIGQFGVGFYSAFMVADEVKVYTHSWQNEGEHLLWTSEGAGTYAIEASEGQRRGCKIVLKLKDDAKDFATESTLKQIIQRYSGFVRFPVNLNGERLNTVEALWLKNKKEISEDDYTEFYKYQAHAFDEPSYRLHFNADAPLALNALLFVPGQNTERFGLGRLEPGVALYSKNVLIDPHPEKLLPEWARFARGVIDSADLPLNISRESMQDSALVQKIGRVITKRLLKMLAEEAAKDPERYATFYKQFSTFLKEGVATDHTHREALAKLLRYESSMLEAGQTTSLEDYISRMKSDQKGVYYLHALSRAAIENGPYLEAFRERGIEVLFVYEPIDEFVFTHLQTFQDKPLTCADQADLELEPLSTTDAEGALSEDEVNAFSTWIRELLGERVGIVRAGNRLVNSPVVALNADKFHSPAMHRIMKTMQQDSGQDLPVRMDLEINPRHTLIKQLNTLRTTDSERAKLLGEQLYDNALLAAGLIDDPRTLVGRLNEILTMATRG